jgi:hypothetical protein
MFCTTVMGVSSRWAWHLLRVFRIPEEKPYEQNEDDRSNKYPDFRGQHTYCMYLSAGRMTSALMPVLEAIAATMPFSSVIATSTKNISSGLSV